MLMTYLDVAYERAVKKVSKMGGSATTRMKLPIQVRKTG